jgi:predicted alpha/beta-fold hydrolase
MAFIRNDAGSLVPPFGGEAFPWIGGDAQTLRHFLRRDAPAPPPSREVLLDLDDGDRLLAAFHPARGNGKAGKTGKAGNVASRGCIIAVHGLNGCMDAQHILWLIEPALAAGFSLLRVNMRGAGPGRPLARGTYNAGTGADLIPFIDAAARLDPDAPLFMMAHSLGGTAALNMILDYPAEAQRLRGLVTIGTPLDMAASAARFHAPRNRLYIRYMLAGLKRIAATMPDIDPALFRAAMAARSIVEFDDHVTARLAGYGDSDAYYAGTSVHRRLQDATIPVLVLQGSNDPWIPDQPALAQPVFSGPVAPQDGSAVAGGNVQVVVTRGGGHVGFHDRLLNWHIRATLSWCTALAEKAEINA